MKSILFYFILLINFSLIAQEVKLCDTYNMMKIAAEQEPSLKDNLKLFKRYADSISNYTILKHKNEILTIPVVVHIMHTNDYSNISNEQIYDAMRIINEDFKKMNSDSSDIVIEFQEIFANVGIEFKLAKLDPYGNCTKGITRTYTELTNEAGENVKELIKWDPRMYLNIWVVSNIESGAGGYSYLPGSAPNNDANAGIVIRASQFGSIGASNGGNFSSRSLTHEIGHYLGLDHTWGGTNDNYLDENCDIDDGIEDTPNTKGSNLNCVPYQNSCGTLDNVNNYMDYSSCGKMYTEGQKTRMKTALNFGQPWHLAARNNLHTDENLMLTGTHEDYIAPDCLANIEFTNQTFVTCNGEEIDWENLSSNYDSALSFLWTFQGGTPSTSSEENPSITYETPGLYNTTLSITTTGGENSLTKENVIYVQDLSSTINAPSINNFYSDPFSSTINDSGYWYKTIFLEGETWHWNNLSSNSNGGSIRIKSQNFVEPGPRKAYTATYDLSNVSAPCYMYYDYAYARRNSQSSDILQVQVSDDCGQSWVTRVNKSTENLVTTEGNFYFDFNPNNNLWEEQRVSLNPFVGSSQVQAVFIFEGSFGNYLYIDNIRFGVPNLSSEELTVNNLHFNVVPNPSNGNTSIEFKLLNTEKIELILFDILGNQNASCIKNYKAGHHKIGLKTLKANLKSGIYYIKLKLDNYEDTKQIIIL